MNISGTMRIYKSEFNGRETYSTTICKKDQFGNYENFYISVQFPQGTMIENNSKINVTKGFLSFFKTKQGLPKIKAVVQEFEEVEQEQAPAQNYQENYYNDDLPF